MQEAERKTITLEDIDDHIDDETIQRFVEYAYIGDYSIPHARTADDHLLASSMTESRYWHCSSKIPQPYQQLKICQSFPTEPWPGHRAGSLRFELRKVVEN